MKVLRLKDKSKLKELVIQVGNRAIVPVMDANGDFIIGKEVLTDPFWRGHKGIIQALTEEIEFSQPSETDEMNNTMSKDFTNLVDAISSINKQKRTKKQVQSRRSNFYKNRVNFKKRNHGTSNFKRESTKD